MSDILERLQGPRTPQGGSWPYPNLHDEAADEIKILRGQVEALDNERNRLWAEKLIAQGEIAQLREENTLLREQNTELVLRGYALLSLLPPETTCGEVQKARAALSAAAIREGGKDDD